jgi:dihydrofolate reductase
MRDTPILKDDLIDAVKRERRDVIITGSLSVVHTLMGVDLIDEYRLPLVPTVLGAGDRLFPASNRPTTARLAPLRRQP